ncbi:hypothetical protein [Caballeronia sp. Lep1P3]|uniref:hypothetical protein n=1 Tax=Caballeronia sp. Lep1P3 TaxID=2878150 RepID=UPI001FD29AA7|nr:hypothetical protein [Caballeronia sp. Lep1P3]
MDIPFATIARVLRHVREIRASETAALRLSVANEVSSGGRAHAPPEARGEEPRRPLEYERVLRERVPLEMRGEQPIES